MVINVVLMQTAYPEMAQEMSGKHILMALEAARKFIETLEYNPVLSAQFDLAAPGSLEGVVAFANRKGYSFTKADLEAVLKRPLDRHSSAAVAPVYTLGSVMANAVVNTKTDAYR